MKLLALNNHHLIINYMDGLAVDLTISTLHLHLYKEFVFFFLFCLDKKKTTTIQTIQVVIPIECINLV